MKAEIFLAAFCLLFVGAYFTYAKHKDGGSNESTITISSDGNYEEIKHSGKIDFNDDETSIKTISPGGFLNYRKNEERLVAKSDKHGVVSYELTEGDDKLALDSNGKKFITEAIKEMIAWGIDANERMERIYKKGGNRALMNEVGNLKNDEVKKMYLDHILKFDSLTTTDMTELAKMISTSLGSDEDKRQVLKKFTADQLKDSATASAYIHAVESFNDDYAKTDALKNIMAAPLTKELFTQVIHAINGLHDENEKAKLLNDMINKGGFDEEQTDQILEATDHFNDDFQKENLLMQLISKNVVPANRFDKLLELVNHLRDDTQKQNLYKKLMGQNNLSEDQWISLINQTSNIAQDFDKSNLLLMLSQKMPKSENIKNAYLKAAKTINDNAEYGKAIRAVE